MRGGFTPPQQMKNRGPHGMDSVGYKSGTTNLIKAQVVGERL